MRSLGLVSVLLAGVLLAGAYSQQLNLEPGFNGDQPIPVVTFEWASKGATPSHYVIAVDSYGRAAYRSDEMGPNGIKEAETGTPYLFNFTVPSATAARIFALTRDAAYFNGNFECAGEVPDEGTIKTLQYSEGPPDWFGHWTTGVRNATTFDCSDNFAIRQLTALFQELSSKLELDPRAEP
jgi:hypothetical protein